MKKFVLAAIGAAAIGGLAIGPAMAQSTGPAPQDSTKMNSGMNDDMSKSGMSNSGKKTTTGTAKSKKTSKKMKSDKMDNMEK
jgi:hypothetical protein